MICVCFTECCECDKRFRGMQHLEEVLWPAALPPESSSAGGRPGGGGTHLMVGTYSASFYLWAADVWRSHTLDFDLDFNVPLNL